MEDVVKYLIKNNITIATMESCTGGLLASLITDVTDASKIFEFGAVTYSNRAKEALGVDSLLIDEYTVYSREVAISMATSISNQAASDIGIGITGKLTSNSSDELWVDIAIYDARRELSYHQRMYPQATTRQENKKEVINSLVDLFNSTIIL